MGGKPAAGRLGRQRQHLFHAPSLHLEEGGRLEVEGLPGFGTGEHGDRLSRLEIGSEIPGAMEVRGVVVAVLALDPVEDLAAELVLGHEDAAGGPQAEPEHRHALAEMDLIAAAQDREGERPVRALLVKRRVVPAESGVGAEVEVQRPAAQQGVGKETVFSP